MIEKKFKNILTLYFSGQIGHAEIVWMAEDLHKRRERRDLFIEKIEDFLENEAGPGRRASDEKLRGLLVKDLSQIEIRELELAMPRGQSQAIAPETGKEEDEPPEEYSFSNRHSVQGKEIRIEKPKVQEKDRSFVMPLIGVTIIVVTFLFMVRFSSIEEDKRKADEAAMQEQEEALSDAAALRQASEYIAEHFKELAAEEERDGTQSTEAAPVMAEPAPPISLVELIGEAGNSEEESIAPATAEGGKVILND